MAPPELGVRLPIRRPADRRKDQIQAVDDGLRGCRNRQGTGHLYQSGPPGRRCDPSGQGDTETGACNDATHTQTNPKATTKTDAETDHTPSILYTLRRLRHLFEWQALPIRAIPQLCLDRQPVGTY